MIEKIGTVVGKRSTMGHGRTGNSENKSCQKRAEEIGEGMGGGRSIVLVSLRATCQRTVVCAVASGRSSAFLGGKDGPSRAVWGRSNQFIQINHVPAVLVNVSVHGERIDNDHDGLSVYLLPLP